MFLCSALLRFVVLSSDRVRSVVRSQRRVRCVVCSEPLATRTKTLSVTVNSIRVVMTLTSANLCVWCVVVVFMCSMVGFCVLEFCWLVTLF